PPPRAAAGWFARRTSGARHRRALANPSASIRRAAAESLRRAGDRELAVEALAAQLGPERDPRVREAMAQTLAYLGAGRDALIEAFAGPSAVAADALAVALASLGDGPSIDALVEALNRADRASPAYDALVLLGAPAVPALRRAVRNGAQPALYELLGDIGDPSALPELLDAATSDAVLTRRAAIRALGRLGDDRGRNAVRRATGDSDPEVARLAWGAFARLAGPADIEPLEAGLEARNQPEPLLRALLRVAPDRGVAALVARVSGTDADAARMAAEVALSVPHPGLVPVLHGLVQEGSRRQEALSALAEAEGGAGFSVLLQLMPAPDVARALAICLRRWRPEGRELGLRALRALPSRGPGAARALLLRAVARDGEAAPLLEPHLQSDEASVRGWAAAGLELLGGADRGLVANALEGEEDPEAFRRLVDLALLLNVRVPDGALRRFASGRAFAAALRARAVRPTRDDRRVLRRALHSAWPPAARAAAYTLGAIDDVDAVPALLALYDRNESIRPLVAQVVGRLAPGHPGVLARRRVASEPALRADWSGGLGRGRRVLRVGVQAEQAPDGVLCLITLPGGRMRLQRTLPSGELLIADVPAGMADVRPLLSELPH
ncbi:MAG: HEAT repeat domain-containing protein, partial [Myxococcota bacterium]